MVEEKIVPKEDSVNRSQFMSVTITAISGVIGAVVGLPAIAYIVGPTLKKQTEDWVRLGVIAKIELGTPTLFKTTADRQTGWIDAQEEISAYNLTEDEQNSVALSNVCTHLGCRLRWVQEQGKFLCPCHAGVFAKEGSGISGPPPRPLDRVTTKIKDGVLYVRRAA